MSIIDEFRTRNFSIYGQWFGILSILLCIALGIANIFHASLVIIFSIICIVQGLVLIFVEIPLLLRICPLSESFNAFVRRFNENWPRAGIYIAFAAIQLASTAVQVTSLVAAGVFLAITSFCYALAAVKGQAFTGSSTLGGQGVAQMIV